METLPNLFSVCDLGRMRYADAFALQKQLQQEVIELRDKPTHGHAGALGHLLLVEHDPPVITVSRRKTARQHLIATTEALDKAGVEIAETDRGGDITYHGPGQLVVYPILDLNKLGLRLHSYMRFLEDVVIRTLAQFGIEGQRDENATGVWVNGSKICAMGVRVSRWVSMHGLALNVTSNLDHFNLIVPCGLAGRTVTSMERKLGKTCPTLYVVKRAIIRSFEEHAQSRLAHP